MAYPLEGKEGKVNLKAELMGMMKQMMSMLEKMKDEEQYQNHPEEDRTLNDVIGEEHQGEPNDHMDKEKKKSMMAMMLKKKYSK
jgi:hypothetical protein